jgi:hypothetical protein
VFLTLCASGSITFLVNFNASSSYFAQAIHLGLLTKSVYFISFISMLRLMFMFQFCALLRKKTG